MSTLSEIKSHSPLFSEAEPDRAQLTPAAAMRQAEEIIRSNSKTFYFATALLTEPARQGIRGLYGFCRATDDLVDKAPDAETGLAQLETWRAQTTRPAEEQSHPILYTWARIREQYPVDTHYEQELIDGVAMDLQFRPYATWADLECYCYHVASTVGLLSIPIIGLAPGVTFQEASPYAIRLGVALQLTNILRDVGEDAQQGRVYFPQEDLRRFGLSRQEILDGVYDPRFIALMRYEIERARTLFHSALPGIRLLHPAARPAVGAAALLYREILREIERIQYQVHRIRAHTSAWRKLAMLPGILLAIATLKRP
jgi:15-cis-phytoene synthase